MSAFTDGTYDIGKSGATRPRDPFLFWGDWHTAPGDEAAAAFAARLRGEEIQFGTVRRMRQGFVDIVPDGGGTGHVKARREGWMRDGARAMRSRP